jgi:branched-chain amino acid aminotransferase
VILRTLDGHLSEAPTANLFIARGGKVLTPPPCDSILLGITRQYVIQICRQAGIPAEECTLRPEDAYSADEAFLTGTGLELMPIRAFDGKPIGVAHNIFSRIYDAYFEIVRSLPFEE